MTSSWSKPAGVTSEEGFPHGLRCARCREEIRLGAPFWTVPEGMIHDSFIEVIVCGECADINN